MKNTADLSAVKVMARRIETEFVKRTRYHTFSWPDQLTFVSITFDDYPETGGLIGSRILEDLNLRGTYYASLGLAGTHSPSGLVSTVDRSLALAEKGHEIGFHTHSHLDCTLYDVDTIQQDCALNRQAATAARLPTLRSFAYPFGGVNKGVRQLIGDTYACGRTVWPGVNRNLIDLAALLAVPLRRSSSFNEISAYINSVALHGGWLIFYTHDVQSSPSTWGCTEALLEKVCHACLQHDIPVIPVTQALNMAKSLNEGQPI